MPLPSPRGRERKDNFISRCMKSAVTKRDYKDAKQRVAVCYSQWRRAKNAKRKK